MDHIELCYNDESSSNDRVMLSFQVRPIIHIYKLITVRACPVVLCCMLCGRSFTFTSSLATVPMGLSVP